MPYLVVKTAANANKSYTLTDTCNKPRLAVKLSNGNTSYVALSQMSTTGVKVKGTNGSTYALVDKKDTYYYTVYKGTKITDSGNEVSLSYSSPQASLTLSFFNSSLMASQTSYRKYVGSQSFVLTAYRPSISTRSTYNIAGTARHAIPVKAGFWSAGVQLDAVFSANYTTYTDYGYRDTQGISTFYTSRMTIRVTTTASSILVTSSLNGLKTTIIRDNLTYFNNDGFGRVYLVTYSQYSLNYKSVTGSTFTNTYYNNLKLRYITATTESLTVYYRNLLTTIIPNNRGSLTVTQSITFTSETTYQTTTAAETIVSSTSS